MREFISDFFSSKILISVFIWSNFEILFGPRTLKLSFDEKKILRLPKYSQS